MSFFNKLRKGEKRSLGDLASASRHTNPQYQGYDAMPAVQWRGDGSEDDEEDHQLGRRRLASIRTGPTTTTVQPASTIGQSQQQRGQQGTQTISSIVPGSPTSPVNAGFGGLASRAASVYTTTSPTLFDGRSVYNADGEPIDAPAPPTSGNTKRRSVLRKHRRVRSADTADHDAADRAGGGSATGWYMSTGVQPASIPLDESTLARSRRYGPLQMDDGATSRRARPVSGSGYLSEGDSRPVSAAYPARSAVDDDVDPRRKSKSIRSVKISEPPTVGRTVLPAEGSATPARSPTAATGTNNIGSVYRQSTVPAFQYHTEPVQAPTEAVQPQPQSPKRKSLLFSPLFGSAPMTKTEVPTQQQQQLLFSPLFGSPPTKREVPTQEQQSTQLQPQHGIAPTSSTEAPVVTATYDAPKHAAPRPQIVAAELPHRSPRRAAPLTDDPSAPESASSQAEEGKAPPIPFPALALASGGTGLAATSGPRAEPAAFQWRDDDDLDLDPALVPRSPSRSPRKKKAARHAGLTGARTANLDDPTPSRFTEQMDLVGRQSEDAPAGYLSGDRTGTHVPSLPHNEAAVLPADGVLNEGFSAGHGNGVDGGQPSEEEARQKHSRDLLVGLGDSLTASQIQEARRKRGLFSAIDPSHSADADTMHLNGHAESQGIAGSSAPGDTTSALPQHQDGLQRAVGNGESSSMQNPATAGGPPQSTQSLPRTEGSLPRDHSYPYVLPAIAPVGGLAVAGVNAPSEQHGTRSTPDSRSPNLSDSQPQPQPSTIASLPGSHEPTNVTRMQTYGPALETSRTAEPRVLSSKTSRYIDDQPPRMPFAAPDHPQSADLLGNIAQKIPHYMFVKYEAEVCQECIDSDQRMYALNHGGENWRYTYADPEEEQTLPSEDPNTTKTGRKEYQDNVSLLPSKISGSDGGPCQCDDCLKNRELVRFAAENGMLEQIFEGKRHPKSETIETITYTTIVRAPIIEETVTTVWCEEPDCPECKKKDDEYRQNQVRGLVDGMQGMVLHETGGSDRYEGYKDLWGLQGAADDVEEGEEATSGNKLKRLLQRAGNPEAEKLRSKGGMEQGSELQGEQNIIDFDSHDHVQGSEHCPVCDNGIENHVGLNGAQQH